MFFKLIPMPNKTNNEIGSILNRVNINEQKHGQSMHPGMTYEEGIRDALEWILDEDKEAKWDWPFVGS